MQLTAACASKRRAARGFGLIEMMITIAIFTILMVMALPVYTTWLANQQIRTASESLLDGLRVAQTEAIKRNVAVNFVLDGVAGWKVQLASDDSLIREAKLKEGSGHVTFTVDPLATDIVQFNGLGRVLDKDGNPFAGRVSIDVTTSESISGVRALRVVIDTAAATGVGIRSCDPALSTADPRGCPLVS